MLVKKYRPKRLAEIVGHARIMESMKAYVIRRDIPHMLFVGPPGNGKTSTVEALRNEFDLKVQDYLELNASDERGIATIRKKVKNFAHAMASSDVGFKICFMDEADAMTMPAQNALRRVIESYPHIRFILACNNLKKIHKAIQSRLVIYNFKALHYKRVEQLIEHVATKEGRRLPADVIVAIRQISHGDARTALNTLEGILSLENPTKEDVFRLHGVTADENIFHLINSALKGDMKALKIMNELNKTAMPGKTIRAMQGIAMRGNMPGLTDSKRLALLEAIGYVPGATEGQRLAAIISRLVAARSS